MTIDLDAIEAAAKAATPGPWMRKGSTVYALWEDNRGRPVNRMTCQPFTDRLSGDSEEAVALHIATMNPITTLALVEEVRRLRTALETVAEISYEPATVREADMALKEEDA